MIQGETYTLLDLTLPLLTLIQFELQTATDASHTDSGSGALLRRRLHSLCEK